MKSSDIHNVVSPPHPSPQKEVKYCNENVNKNDHKQKNMYNNENVSKNDDYKNCGRYKGNSISFRLEIKNY